MLVLMLCISKVVYGRDLSMGSSTTVFIEHDMGDGSFTSRGSFQLSTEPDGTHKVTDVDKLVITDEPGDNEGAELRSLLAKKGLYQLRMYIKRNADSTAPNNEYLYISIPACALQASGFKEDILLHLSEGGSGGRGLHLLGGNYQSPVVGLPRACDASAVTLPLTFRTRIKVAAPQESLVIPLQVTSPKPAVLGNINVGVAVDEKGVPLPGGVGSTDGLDGGTAAPQQSFFRRYWYIIVAVLAFNFLSAPEPEKKKKSAGAGAGAAGKTTETRASAK